MRIFTFQTCHLEYTLMKLTHLSQATESMSLIREVYGTVGMTHVTSFVGNYWANVDGSGCFTSYNL